MSAWTLSRLLALPARTRWSATGLFFAGLNWLLLAPSKTFDPVGQLLPFQDKIAHGALFVTLGFLVRWSLAAGDGRGRRRLGVPMALAVYAAAIEALQPVLGGEGRQFDWLDLALNVAGVCGGWLLFGLAGAPGLKSAGGAPIISSVRQDPPMRKS